MKLLETLFGLLLSMLVGFGLAYIVLMWIAEGDPLGG